MQKIFDNSPWIQSIRADAVMYHTFEHILRILSRRFGHVPEELAAHLWSIDDQEKLDSLIEVAMDCPDLDDFRAALTGP